MHFPASPWPSAKPACVGRHSAVLIGYLCAHLSTGCDRAIQRRALAEAGCEQIVEEQLDVEGSGAQPELHSLLARLRAGDVVVVPHWTVWACLYPMWCAGCSASPPPARACAVWPRHLMLPSRMEQQRRQWTDCQRAMARVRRPLTGAGRPAASDTRRRTRGRQPKLSPGQRAKIADAVLSGRCTTC